MRGAKPAFLQGLQKPFPKPSPAAADAISAPPGSEPALIPCALFLPLPARDEADWRLITALSRTLCAIGPKSPNSVIKAALADVCCRKGTGMKECNQGNPDGLAQAC